MKITIAPASTKTGAAVIRSLLTFTDRNVEITALYRDPKKVPDEFTSHENFTAVKADVSDASSLDFSNADAVLAITPPTFDGRDIAKHSETVSNNVKNAVEEAGSVKRLVLLSSMGAEFDHGVGEIKTNHIAETVFTSTNVSEIVFVRCAYFMENWNMSLETLKAPEPFFFTTITPVDWKVPMIATQDIGLTLARELVSERTPPSKPHIFELHGPEPYTPLDVQRVFSQALGRDVEMKPVEKKDLPEFFAKFFPPSTVDDWVEMAESFIPGGIAARDATKQNEDNIVHGTTTLAEVLTAGTAALRTL